MEFPKSAKVAIAQAFYDKDVMILAEDKTLDEEGGVVTNEAKPKLSFKANVRFITQEEKQTSIGLIRQSDIQITCATDVDVKVDDPLLYLKTKYTVLAVLPSDSHLTILGERWVKQ